jgi:hypothetical protein
MFVLFRAVVYATCFIAILLIGLPARLVARAGRMLDVDATSLSEGCLLPDPA